MDPRGALPCAAAEHHARPDHSAHGHSVARSARTRSSPSAGASWRASRASTTTPLRSSLARPSTAGSGCRALRPLALGALRAHPGECAAWQRPGEPLGARLGRAAQYESLARRGGRSTSRRGRARARAPPCSSCTASRATTTCGTRWSPRCARGGARSTWTSRASATATAPKGTTRPTALADDLRAVLDALGIERADLVAHSWGSSVTLAFALAYPARVRRIVLMGAWIYDEQIPPFFRWAREPGRGRGALQRSSTASARRPRADGLRRGHDGLAGHRRRDRALARTAGHPARRARRRARAVLPADGAALPHDRPPTLLVWGDEDRVAAPALRPARLAQRAARRAPRGAAARGALRDVRERGRDALDGDLVSRRRGRGGPLRRKRARATALAATLFCRADAPMRRAPRVGPGARADTDARCAGPPRGAPRGPSPPGDENASRAREPSADAPGATPIDEPLRATANAPEQRACA